jgi:hypothetical protein
MCDTTRTQTKVWVWNGRAVPKRLAVNWAHSALPNIKNHTTTLQWILKGEGYIHHSTENGVRNNLVSRRGEALSRQGDRWGQLTRLGPDSIAISTTGTVKDKLTCFFQIRPLVLCHASANLTSYCWQRSFTSEIITLLIPVAMWKPLDCYGSWVRNTLRKWMFFRSVCCVLWM